MQSRLSIAPMHAWTNAFLQEELNHVLLAPGTCVQESRIYFSSLDVSLRFTGPSKRILKNVDSTNTRSGFEIELGTTFCQV
jgi:hypothetical protein